MLFFVRFKKGNRRINKSFTNNYNSSNPKLQHRIFIGNSTQKQNKVTLFCKKVVMLMLNPFDLIR